MNPTSLYDSDDEEEEPEDTVHSIYKTIRNIENSEVNKLYSETGLVESKKWSSSGYIYPAASNKIQNTTWSSGLNAWIRTDLQHSLPVRQPKPRIPAGFYWEPSIGGWRRKIELTEITALTHQDAVVFL